MLRTSPLIPVGFLMAWALASSVLACGRAPEPNRPRDGMDQVPQVRLAGGFERGRLPQPGDPAPEPCDGLASWLDTAIELDDTLEAGSGPALPAAPPPAQWLPRPCRERLITPVDPAPTAPRGGIRLRC